MILLGFRARNPSSQAVESSNTFWHVKQYDIMGVRLSTGHQTGGPRPRRSTVTVMFADMVGYSHQLQRDEVRNAAQSAKSIALFKSLIADYNGKVANVAGDGLLALFPNSTDAVTFAIEVQRNFYEQAVWSDGDPIKFRVALSQGDISVRQGNVQGHCVNVAARLQSLAAPGGIVLTGDLVKLLDASLQSQVVPLGRRVLKNITGSVEVYSVATDRPETPEEPRKDLLPSRPRQPSVAVLALINLSGDPANDHLCEGIAEDVIDNLSRFRNLIVIARHSAFLFSVKSRTPAEIGQRLGVSYLLSGSLRRSGKRIRVGVELIATESEAVVWADRIDIDRNEILDLLDEITSSVASRLAVQVDQAESRREALYPTDMRAYGLALRSHRLMLRFTKEANAHARHLLEEAIDVSPDYARAYAALSRTHNLDWRYSWSSNPNASLETATKLALHAVDLDSLDARAFAELGFAHLYGKQHTQALADYRRATHLNPSDADIIAEHADCLTYTGDPETGMEMLERAMRLNPYFPDWYLWCLADAYWTMGRPSDVISTVLRMQDPSEGSRLLAVSYTELGLFKEAQEQAAIILNRIPSFSVTVWRERLPHVDRALNDRFADGLKRAGLPE
jgi:adenylate cyclase